MSIDVSILMSIDMAMLMSIEMSKYSSKHMFMHMSKHMSIPFEYVLQQRSVRLGPPRTDRRVLSECAE